MPTLLLVYNQWSGYMIRHVLFLEDVDYTGPLWRITASKQAFYRGKSALGHIFVAIVVKVLWRITEVDPLSSLSRSLLYSVKIKYDNILSHVHKTKSV